LRVFIRLLALVALFVLLIAGIGSLLPREYSFEQSTLIAAPTDVVFGRVNDLHYWLKWSPWRTETLGSDKVQVGEPFAGTGAKLHWEDPRGPGKLWFTESDPPVRIAYEMVFAQFRDTRGEFLLVDRGEMTEVTWKSRGRLPSGPFYGYLRGLYRSGMERQFQLSLQRLKTECEALVAKK
jgi:hypothetical protein